MTHPNSLQDQPSLRRRIATVLVGSDVCPAGVEESCSRAGESSHLFGDYSGLWDAADFRVLNLGCPLTNAEQRIRKTGTYLKASPACLALLANARANAICLANDHIRDYGGAGVLETIQACQAAGLPTVGAGSDLDRARTPLCVGVNGLQVGIVAMSEHPSSIAGPDSPGANPIDYPNFSVVKELKARADFVLVLVHGGTETLPVPRPGLVELCRFLVDQGAGAVIVQDPHCVGCYEVYRQALILYGQGNPVFGPGPEPGVKPGNPTPPTGMLVELRLENHEPSRFRFHPFEQSPGSCGIRVLARERKGAFLNDLEQRSKVLENPAELQSQWMRFCRTHRSGILARSLGISGFWATVDRRVRVSRFLTALTNADLRRNMISCESHRELLEGCLRPDE